MDELTRMLDAARDGDRLALSTFIRTTQPDVWRFCAHLVDPTSAEDLTQEVYLRAMRSLRRFRGDASARTWLLAIARNTCADTIRRRSRRRQFQLDQRHLPPDPHVPAGSGEIDLLLLVHSLEADRREAFVLTQLVGLPYSEAAEICDVPIGTIRSRVARARQQLAEAIAIDPATPATA